tara:strand:- start:1100 stop:1387 length:288 start_codon:yes stop_codon:yes gene_type:complete
MGSIKRKMARNKAKRKKKQFEKAMKQQLLMFDKLGDECAACQKPFDKKSKEHATTWNVVVREEEEIVRLYCPECWDKANKIIKEIENDLRVHKEG